MFFNWKKSTIPSKSYLKKSVSFMNMNQSKKKQNKRNTPDEIVITWVNI